MVHTKVNVNAMHWLYFFYAELLYFTFFSYQIMGKSQWSRCNSLKTKQISRQCSFVQQYKSTPFGRNWKQLVRQTQHNGRCPCKGKVFPPYFQSIKTKESAQDSSLQMQMYFWHSFLSLSFSRERNDPHKYVCVCRLQAFKQGQQ